MAVTLVNTQTAKQAELDVAMCSKLYAVDPFLQFSCPCWMTRVSFMIAEWEGSIINMRPTRQQLEKRDKDKIMAIRTVAAAQAPARLFIRGGISSKQDYIDILQALGSLKADQAAIVDMDAKAWVKSDGSGPMDKPEVTFANSLRRRFEQGGLNITAYQSGTMQVTVRRLTALEIKEKEAGKGKRKKK